MQAQSPGFPPISRPSRETQKRGRVSNSARPRRDRAVEGVAEGAAAPPARACTRRPVAQKRLVPLRGGSAPRSCTGARSAAIARLAIVLARATDAGVGRRTIARTAFRCGFGLVELVIF